MFKCQHVNVNYMNKQQKLEIKRHSLAHILAAAVLEMFPEAKFGIGPNIENGFYYDFELPRTLIPEDLPILEEKMKRIIKKNYLFEKMVIPRQKAIELFQKAKQDYKVEILSEEAKEKEVSLYKTGNFVDLCKGPHIDSTGELNIKSFKLTKIAGAYWRGNEKNKMLQRIYGVAFNNNKELKEYLKQLEEAEKRDHRRLGKELDLFLIDPIVGSGLVLWQPKGALLWRIMEDFWYNEHLKAGYDLVRTPHIGNRKLWEISGHWGFYNDSMYPPLEVGQSLKDAQKGKKVAIKEEYLLKPMNCPFHVVIYNSKPRSYRELPIRWAESATVYRYEKSGELSGLTRVRGFTQDDAHIICTKEQAEEELKKVLDFIIFIFKSFGFNEYKVYLSVRDPNNSKYAGSDEGWNFTERVLEKVAKEKNLDIEKDVGGAVFYGPKLDFKIKDCLNREWQCSTLQYDFNLPEKFDMNYIDKNGNKKRPYMLHRALFGSFERFIGILIEHNAGAFPIWLSPVQVKVLPVSSKKHIDYAKKVKALLLENNIRVQINGNNESIGKKIREAEKQKIPYMIVVGDKEAKSNSVSVRTRGKGKTEDMKTEVFVKKVLEEIKKKK
jgi:threonyl-tRNA synthetase